MIPVDSHSPWLEHISEGTLSRWPDDIYLIDSQSTAPEGLDPSRCIVICDQVSHKDLMGMALNSNIHHIVQVSHPEFDREINLAAAIISDTDAVITDPTTYYFDVKDQEYGAPKVYSAEFSSSKEKGFVLSEMQGFLEAAEMPQTILNSIQVISDEIFSNAIIWGPPKKLQSSKFSNLQKTKEKVLPSGAQARMVLALDPRRLMVGVMDPFGTMDTQKIISRLYECYVLGVSSAINLGPGGTGIGLFLSFEQAISLTLLVSKNRQSFVGFTIPLGISSKKRSLVFKNFHLSVVE